MAQPLFAASTEEVRAALDQRIAQNTTRGIVVALIAPDGSTRIVAAGESGNSARPQVDGDTLFEIGSLTKLFTSTVLAQRVEEGAFTLDTPIRAVLPQEPAWKSPGVADITFKQLATHTSGLPRLPGDWRFYAGMMVSLRNPYASYSADRFLAYARAMPYTPPAKPAIGYSNFGVGLMGQVLAAQEGVAYEELVRRRILAPLGIKSTGIDVAPEYLAAGYTSSLLPTSHWDLPALPGAGALRSSANDLAKFVAAHMQGKIAGARLAQQEHFHESDLRGVGLGWFITRRHGEDLLWHNGGTGGFRTFAGFSRKSGAGVVVLSNSSVGVDDIGLHLLNPKFKLDDDPREVNIIAMFVSAVLALGLVQRAWAVRRAASKRDFAWSSVDIFAIAVILLFLAPWEWVGPIARDGYFLVLGGLLIYSAWKVRAQPMRAPTTSRYAAAQRFAHAVSISVLALALVNLAT